MQLLICFRLKNCKKILGCAFNGFSNMDEAAENEDIRVELFLKIVLKDLFHTDLGH